MFLIWQQNNGSKTLTKHISCEFSGKFDNKICNLYQI